MSLDIIYNGNIIPYCLNMLHIRYICQYNKSFPYAYGKSVCMLDFIVYYQRPYGELPVYWITAHVKRRKEKRNPLYVYYP
jgi:hypothetical protein